jgi:hypothetical protein
MYRAVINPETITSARDAAPDDAVEPMLSQAWPLDALAPRGAMRHRGRAVGEDGRAIEVQRHLDELAMELGFLLPPKAQKQLRQAAPADPDEFTDALFHADGMDSRLFPHLRHQVRARVSHRLS